MRVSKNANGGSRGFTLIEVLVVMAILTALGGIVMPLAAKALRRSRALGTIASLNRELGSARLQAVKTGFPVIVEFSKVGNLIHSKTFQDRNPDFLLGTYTPPGGGAPLPELVLHEFTADSTFHFWKQGSTIDDLTASVPFNGYISDSSLVQKVVFQPTGALTVPQDAANSGPPTPTGGRGIYFADTGGSPLQGLNFFRVTIYSDSVARSRVEKYEAASSGYMASGWSWK